PVLFYLSDVFFFFQAEDGIRDFHVTGVQTCALPIWNLRKSLAFHSGLLGLLAFFEHAAPLCLPSAPALARLVAGLTLPGLAIVQIGRASCREGGESSWQAECVGRTRRGSE